MKWGELINKDKIQLHQMRDREAEMKMKIKMKILQWKQRKTLRKIH